MSGRLLGAPSLLVLMALLAALPARRCAVAAFRAAPPIARRCPVRSVTARFMSAKYSHDDLASMKVAELRDLLRQNGLAVSGIKAVGIS
ncbi:hypothetical protein ACHAXT_000467 [Thalassiosira profunda]